MILIFIGALAFMFFNTNKDDITLTPIDTRPTPFAAHDVALAAARAWRADAYLATLHSTGEVGATGRGNFWRFVFISPDPAMRGRGYEVAVEGQAVRATNEIAYVGSGAVFPSNILSQEDAITRVHSFKGYESASVLGIEAVYGAKEQVWYWGVRTPQGVVSVEARAAAQ